MVDISGRPLIPMLQLLDCGLLEIIAFVDDPTYLEFTLKGGISVHTFRSLILEMYLNSIFDFLVLFLSSDGNETHLEPL